MSNLRTVVNGIRWQKTLSTYQSWEPQGYLIEAGRLYYQNELIYTDHRVTRCMRAAEIHQVVNDGIEQNQETRSKNPTSTKM